MKYKPYNLSVDVLSFGVLLWYIMACTKSYQGFALKMSKQIVAENDIRSTIKDIWPNDIKVLLQKCWINNSGKRPNLDTVTDELRNIIMNERIGKYHKLDLDLSEHSKNTSKFKTNNTITSE